MIFDGQSEMGSGLLGELAKDGGGDGFEFMFDVSDLLTDNNIEMPSHENILESYLTCVRNFKHPPIQIKLICYVSDLLTDNNIEMPSHENIIKSYLTCVRNFKHLPIQIKLICSLYNLLMLTYPIFLVYIYIYIYIYMGVSAGECGVAGISW